MVLSLKGFGILPKVAENFDEPSADEQQEAKMLRSAYSLYKIYEVEVPPRKREYLLRVTIP